MNIEDKELYLLALKQKISKAEHAAIVTGEITPLLALKKEYTRVLTTINNHKNNTTMTNFKIDRDFFITGESEPEIQKKHRDAAMLLGTEEYRNIFNRFAYEYGGDGKVAGMNGADIAKLSDEEYEAKREEIAESLTKVKPWKENVTIERQLRPDLMQSYSGIDPRKAEHFANTFGHDAFMQTIGLGDIPTLSMENLKKLNPNVGRNMPRKHDAKSTG